MFMRITVQRQPSKGGATVGKLSINGAFVCFTLEDEIREIFGRPVAEWKIKGATAIPGGEYHVTLEMSQRFGPDTLTVNAVPGFEAIRMHAGNTSADTEGCLLLGMTVAGNTLAGGTSRPAVALVKDRVKQAIAAGAVVLIDISNPEAVA
jgi:hypothetical protein